MKYAIYNTKIQGYLYESEDTTGGFDYSPDIWEDTVFFSTYEDAKFQCNSVEEVREITKNRLELVE